MKRLGETPAAEITIEGRSKPQILAFIRRSKLESLTDNTTSNKAETNVGKTYARKNVGAKFKNAVLGIQHRGEAHGKICINIMVDKDDSMSCQRYKDLPVTI